MITVVNKKKPIHGGKTWLYEMSGESTDNKPSVLDGNTVGVNSLFLELDTGDFYYLKTPAQSGTKDVLIAEQDFTGERQEGYDFYEAELNEEPFNFDKVTVVFDGVEYECQDNLGTSTESDAWFMREYGAPEDGSGYDFSTYPFSLYSTHGQHMNQVLVDVADGNEHTIEVYIDSSTPAVWKKVGSGGEPVLDESED